MVKKLKAQPPRVSRPVLPITPTANPQPEDVIQVTHAILEITQMCLLSPQAVISALKAAEDVYVTNAENKGMPAEVIENCQVLGMTLSKVMLKMHEDGEKEPSQILTRPTGLVGPDGQPLAAAPPTMHTKTPEPATEEETTDEAGG